MLLYYYTIILLFYYILYYYILLSYSEFFMEKFHFWFHRIKEFLIFIRQTSVYILG